MQTAGGETQGPKQPAHRIYAKYKFRLASPAPAQPDLPPRTAVQKLVLPFPPTGFTTCQNQGMNQVGKIKEK